jgi:hypothetical protein
MTAAFIEHRPKSSDPKESTSHFVIVLAGGQEVGGSFKTQKEAKDKACDDNYRPVHVARVRHFQDRDQPAHWRVDPC